MGPYSIIVHKSWWHILVVVVIGDIMLRFSGGLYYINRITLGYAYLIYKYYYTEMYALRHTQSKKKMFTATCINIHNTCLSLRRYSADQHMLRKSL